MGHQVNFYATPADIAQLEVAIGKREPVVVLHYRSPTAKPRTLPSLRFTEDAQAWLFYFLVREADLSEVAMRHVPAQGYWTVDVDRSPVVEFTSCYFDEKILRRGRVYYVDGFYDENDEWVDKPEEFRVWATAVLKTTRRTLNKHGMFYIGKDGLAWLQREQGKLVDL